MTEIGGTALDHRAFFLRKERDGGTTMGLFFYFIMFVLACGFGWWARGEKPNN